MATTSKKPVSVKRKKATSNGHSKSRASVPTTKAFMLVYPHLEMYRNRTGFLVPRVAGRRISVADIAVWHLDLGETVDEIARHHELKSGEIYAALSYYYDHRTEIEQQEAEMSEYAQQAIKSNPDRFKPLPIEDLKARKHG